jgi:TRAP-type C4-dicarboxylate transport system substrate-binding protein
VRLSLVFAAFIGLSASVSAEPVRLRMAAIAPDGSGWARELRATSREVAAATNGNVEIKWYLGGIAGDEIAALERVRHGQLDGLAGASFCVRLALSLRVMQAVGLIQNRDEARAVLGHLRPALDHEFAQQGFVNLGVGTFGIEVIFSRAPVTTMDDLRRRPIFIWRYDETFLQFARRMGIRAVPLSLNEADHAYDEDQIDGFYTIPAAALSFQWLARVRYFTQLPGTMLPACVVVTQTALDALPMAQQTAVRDAMARLSIRFEAVGRHLDDELLGKLLEKQGLRQVRVSDAFRAEFLMLAHDVREQGGFLSAELLSRVQGWLADYRAEAVRPTP